MISVLVVEDEIIIRKSLELTLKNDGITVIPGTSSGEEALQIARRERPDVVLMDINLRDDMDGISTAGEIGRICNAAVVFISAYDYKGKTMSTEGVNFAGYLSKPVREEHLLAAIRGAKALLSQVHEECTEFGSY